MKKRFTAALLACVFAISFMTTAFAGYDSGVSTAESAEDTFFTSITIEDAETISTTAVSTLAETSETYYTSVEDAAEILREALCSRENETVIYYQTEITNPGSYSSVLSELATEIMDAACEHTGVPDEGDYIYWHLASGSTSISASHQMMDSTYYITFTFSYEFYTTAEQEEEMDEAVDDLIEDLGLDGMSDYRKVKAIYDYICENVTYDYDNLYDDDYVLKYTAYAALINGTAVCQGYSSLFYRLALEAGIDSRFICGNISSGGHAWNIVALDGEYYYLDSTWDAGDEEYSYFLLGSTNFLKTHSVDRKYSDFIDDYDISEDDYDIPEDEDEDEDSSETSSGTSSSQSGSSSVSSSVSVSSDDGDEESTETQETYVFSDDDGTGTWAWADEYIYACYEAGIITGFDDGTFDADGTLTRAQAAVIIAKAFELDAAGDYTFADDTGTGSWSWAGEYIYACYEAGIITGRGNDVFDAEGEITRAELAVMVCRAMGLDTDGITSVSFTDTAGHFACEYIEACVNAGIISGMGDGTFAPDESITRAQSAAVFARALGLAE